MVIGIVIPAAVQQPLELRDFAGLDDYRAAVDGWIEAVDLLELGVTIYLNDEGAIAEPAVKQPRFVPVAVSRP